MLLLLFGAIRGKESDGPLTELAVALLGIAILVMCVGSHSSATVFNGLFIDDAFRRFMKVLVLLGSLVTLVMAQDFLASASGSTSSSTRSSSCFRRSAC